MGRGGVWTAVGRPRGIEGSLRELVLLRDGVQVLLVGVGMVGMWGGVWCVVGVMVIGTGHGLLGSHVMHGMVVVLHRHVDVTTSPSSPPTHHHPPRVGVGVVPVRRDRGRGGRGGGVAGAQGRGDHGVGRRGAQDASHG